MKTIIDPVSEVRAWREQVSEIWKGKKWEDIEQELEERAARLEREVEQERIRKNADAA
jgi:hypothetical protein